MAIAGTFRKRRTIACVQHRLAAVFDERDFAFEHIDELVLVAVPVALAGPAAGRQPHQIDAEIAKPARVAQTLPRTCSTGRVEGRRIARALTCGHGGDVDLGHALLLRSNAGNGHETSRYFES